MKLMSVSRPAEVSGCIHDFVPFTFGLPESIHACHIRFYCVPHFSNTCDDSFTIHFYIEAWFLDALGEGTGYTLEATSSTYEWDIIPGEQDFPDFFTFGLSVHALSNQTLLTDYRGYVTWPDMTTTMFLYQDFTSGCT
jgi:hypothetical protein